ncbi:hypothetical protein R6V09_14930 [Streptomyces sp. W16]|uniref:hypothetical protein n=1 Tax=Streptomyces sp. W16 TaxID=3076631 RepID=UPI00295B0AB0|nr:hypothetical protein [Streptomyces sp. W16]MDV9171411.1 hypothetical protein [Streptomyces sp. W16]
MPAIQGWTAKLYEAGSWCRLFREPESDSDLDALRTRAVREGEDDDAVFVADGQKVWTTNGQQADMGCPTPLRCGGARC